LEGGNFDECSKTAVIDSIGQDLLVGRRLRCREEWENEWTDNGHIGETENSIPPYILPAVDFSEREPERKNIDPEFSECAECNSDAREWVAVMDGLRLAMF